MKRSALHIILLLAMLLGSWPVLFALTPTFIRDTDSVSVFERKVSIDFRINSCEIDSNYSGNSRNLTELHSLIEETRTSPLMSLDSIRVSGYASPDGPLQKNRELSLRRAVSLRDYLNRRCGVPDSLMSFGENAVPWNLFREIIAGSEYPWRDEALRIINVGNDTDAADNTRRMNRLKRLAGGEAWKVLKSDILPMLRSAYVVTTVISAPHSLRSCGVSDDLRASGALPEKAAELRDSPKPHMSPASVGVFTAPAWAVKTNAAYLAAGVTNLGVEMAVSPHWSIDVPLVYSPYTLAQNYRMRFLYLQPEARYWLDRPLQGHFFGVHAHVGVANVSLDHDNRYQTPGGFYGGGVSYGYSLPVAKRWSIEFAVGAGYFFTKYDTYYNIGIPIGQRYKKGTPLNYWGIDKLGIDIVYRFGDKSGRRESKLGKEVVVK